MKSCCKSRALILRRLLTILITLIPFSSLAAEQNSQSGFLDFNIYPSLSDVDNDTTFTLNIAAALHNRFSYFSLTNIGNQSSEDELEDTVSYYTEQNIRWQIADDSPLDLTLQMNFRSGEDNDRHRLGVRWRFNDTAFLEDFFNDINLAYSVNLHAIQFDKDDAYVWQMEHVFNLRLPLISDRVYLAGFIDHTFNENLPDNIPSNPVVAEVQLGFELLSNFYVITEYRVNQYRRSNVNNLAAGVQFKVVW